MDGEGAFISQAAYIISKVHSHQFFGWGITKTLHHSHALSWKTGKGSCGLMEQRFIELGQIGRYMYGRRGGNSFLIELQVQQSSMEGEIT